MNTFRALLGSIIYVMLCACSTREPSGPIRFGMYRVPLNRLNEVRDLGIDFVVGPSTLDYLTEAAKFDIKVITAAEARVHHPALLGSMLKDEPDLNGISPELMEGEYQLAKIHAKRPIFLNVSSGYSIEAYAHSCDIVMFDWYPINWTPMETFFSHLRAARLASGQKPFYAVIQAFDWSKYPKLMPRGLYRKPTSTELQAMTLWAAMNGSKGIAFYSYDDGHDSVNAAPELASAIRTSIDLVKEYEWFFEAPRQWIKYPFEFKFNDDKTNGIGETSIAIRAISLDQARDVIFVMAANTTDHTIVVRGLIPFDEVSTDITFNPLEVKFLTGRGQFK